MGFIRSEGGRRKSAAGVRKLRSMRLCLVNGAFKPLKGPFHGKRLRGGSRRWIDLGQMERERRQKRFDSSVTGTRGGAGVLTSRNDLRTELVRWGSSSKDPHVRFRICVLPSPVLARLPGTCQHSTTFPPSLHTQQQWLRSIYVRKFQMR